MRCGRPVAACQGRAANDLVLALGRLQRGKVPDTNTMWRFLVVSTVVTLATGSPQNLDGLIKETFNNNNNNGGTGGGLVPNQGQDGGNGSSVCECVPYYQCENGVIIKNGVGLIDIRARDGECSSYLDTCCLPPDLVSITTTTTTTASTPTHGGPSTPSTAPPARGACGRRNAEGVGFRITGAEQGESQFGEFPWMVAVLQQEKLGEAPDQKLNVYKCGGAVLHPQVVLTAAHCVQNATGLKIRAGEWDTQTTSELLPHQDRAVSQVLVHPDFHSQALYYDVALLVLESPLELADNVDVVCLPAPGSIFEHGRCFASGWGKDLFGKEGRYQVILKKVELPMVPQHDCVAKLRKTRLGNYFKLDDSFVCAGGEPGKDTCKGDGGSPLVCPLAHDHSRFQQVGIVAWGIGCGGDTPAVYANVALTRPWIDRQMADRGFDPAFYTY